MHRVATRTVMSTLPRYRSFTSLFNFSSRSFHVSTKNINVGVERVTFYGEPMVLKGPTKGNKRGKESQYLAEENLSDIVWWKEKIQFLKKPSSIQLTKRLKYSNLLGLDTSLKSGSLKEGALNWELLQFKSRFPREVLLCRVGDFYESVGIDACILVEHAGLNPFGGLRTDSIPKAGCPVVNLRQTLNDLTNCGYSVCIVEEVQGPTHSRSRKGRFISGHAHPGSPYVYGLAGVEQDVEFPEPMPVTGISRTAKGYCMVSVLETMKTYSVEDGLTEEAIVTKLRTCRFHHLFLHSSLRRSSSGTSRWGEFGEGGLLWSECYGKHFEWFDGEPIIEVLSKVRELYGLDDDVSFRNVTISSQRRPRPLYLGTATQIGALPTEGIPSLLKVLLPSDCTGLPVMYIRDLLLNPPTYAIAATIQEICKLMADVTCPMPEFTSVSSAKLVKLLELKEVNHMEFCRIKDVVDEVSQMYKNPELRPILEMLIEPTWMSTGTKIDCHFLAEECELISHRIRDVIHLGGEMDQRINNFPLIPSDFFEDMESQWKGRVKRIHAEDVFAEVDKAAKALSIAVEEDFLPISLRVKAVVSSLGSPKGEISYSREHEAVWFRGKRFAPAVWANTPGEMEIKQLKPATDLKGRKVGEEWFTTNKVDDALNRYHEAGDIAKAKVLELLKKLSAELQDKTHILVFSSMLLVIAKALFAHVSEGRRRKWVFPTLVEIHNSTGEGASHVKRMDVRGISPYWFDIAQGNAIMNTMEMKSLILLTGPNGGGKSSMLRSICAIALLGMCGLMVPAEYAHIPHFDSVMLHMKSYDSPVDGKSSFQIEMSEMRSIISGTTSKSLVLVDEICRGTEVAKGTCLAGSIIEILDQIGCLGIVSTHLHDIFSLPLKARNIVYKAMGVEFFNDPTNPKPTWKLIDGICKESLAFETARCEGVSELVIKRAEELYLSINGKSMGTKIFQNKGESLITDDDLEFKEVDGLIKSSVATLERIESIFTMLCQKKLIDMYKKKCILELVEVTCVMIGAREQPPPKTVGASSVYVLLRPDKKLYIGHTDDLSGRLRAHRSKRGMQNASFLYILVPGKSIACQLETLLINQLPEKGFQLTNKADGKHRNFGTSNFNETLSLHHR